jgi:hypothetical protein
MDPRCEKTRELAAELALGIVEAEERGHALEHLAQCPECRRLVGELSGVADELLLLAPVAEVPVGFEERALAPLLSERRPRRRHRLLRVLVPAGAAAAAVAITLAVVADDLRLASDYRSTLGEANGRRFEAYALKTPDDRPAGQVFAYEGAPSWLLMTVEAGYRSGIEGAELVMEDGRRVPIRWCSLDKRRGTCGGAIGVDLREVSVLRLLPTAGDPIVARFAS